MKMTTFRNVLSAWQGTEASFSSWYHPSELDFYERLPRRVGRDTTGILTSFST